LLQHIEAALDVEEASLSQIHRTVGKQISRLQLEERMLKMLQERLLNEAEQTGGADLTAAEEQRQQQEREDAGAPMKKKDNIRGSRLAEAERKARSFSRKNTRPCPSTKPATVTKGAKAKGKAAAPAPGPRKAKRRPPPKRRRG
jgi:hypothetical protein